MPALDIDRLTQTVAADLAASGPSDTSYAIAQLIEASPDAALHLAEHILQRWSKPPATRQGRKAAKKITDDDLAAYAFLLSKALEGLRYAVEAKRVGAAALAEKLREQLLAASRRPGVDPAAIILILQQFVAARLEIGDELRNIMPQLIEAHGVTAASSSPLEDIGIQFAEIAKDLDNDPFAIHTMLDTVLHTLPEDMRAMIALAAVSQDIPALHEASVGWLLNDAGSLRRVAMGALEKGFDSSGMASGATLRRMIALRNWLPEAERPHLDRAIKTGRKRIACASWPEATVVKAYASGIDGAGAQSIVVIAAKGRERSLANVLFKLGFGVREAFVHHRISKAEADIVLDGMAGQVPISPVTLDYLGFATRYFLGVNAQLGVLPPFGLLDVAETVGLTDLNPDPRGLDSLVAMLCADIAPARATPQALATALKTSATWDNHQPMIGSWFDDSDETASLLAPRKLAKAKRKAALLALPLRKRRRWWAELVAWTAHSIRQDSSSSDWEDYALVARELLGERPLDEFGIMHKIAENTIEAALY
jgi:hypothetical protein